MPGEYEYAWVTDAAEMPDAAKLKERDFKKEIAIGFKPQRDRIASVVDSMDGGGWEVISHDLAIHDGILIVTYLLRRPRS